MLAIIAHHFVVNSTVTMQFVYDKEPSTQQMFLQIWGMWGKTAINSFILISGFFMCRMRMTPLRIFKLIAQSLFYGISILLIFAITGYQPLTIHLIIKGLFGFITGINCGFTASFICFYVFVPYYNKLIGTLTHRQYFGLLIGLLSVFTVASTFFKAQTMNEPFWYMTLYFVAAYIRNYPNKFTESLKLTSIFLTLSVIFSILSVIVITYTGAWLGDSTIGSQHYWFVSDSNKLLAFSVGLNAFLVFKNLPKFQSRIINWFSAGTFAVLLIHASSDTMRQWLWQDVVKVPQLFQQDIAILVLNALLVPIVIFTICSTIDYFRRNYIERPILKWIYNENVTKPKWVSLFIAH